MCILVIRVMEVYFVRKNCILFTFFFFLSDTMTRRSWFVLWGDDEIHVFFFFKKLQIRLKFTEKFSYELCDNYSYI